MKIIIIIALSIFLSSCATVLNKPMTKTTIVTTKPSKIVYKTDTIVTINNELTLNVERKKEALKITAITDSLQENINIKSRLSPEFYGNLFLPTGLLGLLIDLKTPKRFTYPNKIYLDLSNTKTKFTTFKRDNQKGEIYLHFSFPHVNNFLLQPTNEGIRKSTGFWGLSLGLDYYYQNKKFLNLSGSSVLNIFVPIPAAIKFTEDYQRINSTYLSLTNNHRIQRFSFGYGLSFGENTWSFVKIMSPEKDEIKNHNALGLMFSSYCQLGKSFNFGVLYRPTFIRFNIPNQFQYEHLISIDFAWKIRLNKDKAIKQRK